MLDYGRYWLGQGTRIAWYLAQYRLAARASGPVVPREHRSPQPMPTLGDLLRDVRELLAEDWRNVAAGVYRLDDGGLAQGARAVADALRYFQDLPEVNARRRRNDFREVAREPAALAGLPDYYRRNFHFQTDGYLSAQSARLYDQQVEVLFMGSAAAMRRQALVPLSAWLKRTRPAAPLLVDVGCGTAQFVRSVLANFADVRALGVDLSHAYLDHARRSVGSSSRAGWVQAPAEALPLAADSADLISCIYLLHEVPGEIRAEIAGEAARVLKPGGRLIVVDSLQYGDRPDYDGLISTFPSGFHEPFYEDYARCDLTRLFRSAGLEPGPGRRAFLSKVLVFDKPPAGRRSRAA